MIQARSFVHSLMPMIAGWGQFHA